MTSAHFEMTVSVSTGDIDEQNHVNNTVYLRWVQGVATAHWQAVASPEAQETVGWVVLRHEIDFKTPAALGDKIILRTWVGKATRLTFERFTEIRRNGDGQLLSRLGRYGARLMHKPVGRCACQLKCACSFRAEFGSQGAAAV